MNILVFNCGSSSLKYRLLDLPAEKELAGGEAQRVGPPTARPSCIFHRVPGRPERTVTVPMPDHAAAFREVLKLLAEDGGHRPDAAGHRFVHGGTAFTAPVRITPDVLRQLESIRDLAPIHNPPALSLIRACLTEQPDLPEVAVFDTAFHATIPPEAATYAVPAGVAARHGIRKFGFHGTSHEFVMEEAVRLLGITRDEFTGVSCHLGSGGASLCAIRNGRSVENTMGFSPLQGLVMSTRCGDLDPTIALQLLLRGGGAADPVQALLNHRCGVLGLSGTSADIRDVLDQVGRPGAAPSDRLALTAQVYLWRLRKYLGAYLAVAGAPKAVIFTDTIGETNPHVRWAMCSGLEWFGIRLDPALNRRAGPLPMDVAAPDSRVRLLVICTNEELAIARRVYSCLTSRS